MNKKWLALGVILLLVVGFVAWRILRPPLSDEAQIAANIEGIVEAANNRSARDVAWYLSDEFRFGGQNKKEFRAQLVGGFFQYRRVEMSVADVQTEVKGDTATSIGSFDLGVSREFDAPPQKFEGEFRLEWKRENDAWKVVSAEGAPLGLGLGLQ